MASNSYDYFNKMEKATRAAFDRVGNITGGENDADLNLYKSFTPPDFTKLMQEYGENDVVRYIKEMESKMILRRNNG
jgi:hypothetical protein